ncbi:MAG: DUF3656 domain-containing protein [Victivallaceae bacterium]|nr:DUF3656 domain-containing protein [Victivallaceae bacterium]
MKEFKPKTLPELLAPAGTPECAIAACDAGADAVYCGLGRFNARARAGNFTMESMGRVIEYLHGEGRKLYLAVNTLVKESELPAAAEMLAEAVALGPDAVIVQDLGVLRMIRKYFPELVIHASTQMGIHNSSGLAEAARLGVRRVILERQVTMGELRRMAAASPVELEVFIHGSLCCSLSGRCLLSAQTGGWSGNRGQCRQLCRRSWHFPGGSGFALSPGDLDGESMLPELIGLGVASLKIEGRLRGPEYVWKTVRAYRLLLDGGDRGEAARLLAATVRRRGTTGFFEGGGGSRLIDPARPGFLGNVVGRVLSSDRDGLHVRATGRIHLGDKYRLYPPDGGESADGFELARLAVSGAPALSARSGDECFMSGRFVAQSGWLLCKTGENGYDFSRRVAALPPARFPVKLKLELTSACWRVSSPALAEVWVKTVDFAPAERAPFAAPTAEAAFREAVPSPWRAGRIDVRVSGSFFVPSSLLKALRREFWGWAAERLDPAPNRSASAGLMRFFKDYEAMTAAKAAAPVPAGAECQMCAFVPEGGLPAERERVKQAYESGIRRFRVNSLHGFDLLREFPGAVAVTEFPLPVANSMAAAELADLGATAAGFDPELDEPARAALREHSPVPLIEPGEPPLLVTRIALPSGRWSDRRGNIYTVDFDPVEKLYRLFSEQPFSVETLH